MDTRNIGKIIKEARLAKKMTQNEVVGNFITRNMLSQIESGTAMPSVKTLDYLCKVLDIKIEASELSAMDNSEGDSYLSIRQLFRDRQYEKVIGSECREDFKDEVIALKAMSYLALADRLLKTEDIKDNHQAVEYARKAKELSSKGIFSDLGTELRADETLKRAAAALSAYYADML
ncbi:MAG: helix-turn-helix transcriptional regulator [Ruminococcus sp.]|nr:helix-turn-helix transcriptional regulator [Ruminococcus sp.]